MRVLGWCVLVACGLTAACGGGPGESPADTLPATQVLLLEDLGQDVMLPTWDRVAQKGATLAQTLGALDAQPDEPRLLAAQTAWRDARSAWNRCEALLIGPESDRFLPDQVDTSPVNQMLIDGAIAGTDALDAAFFSSVGSTRKGFFAIEYLLFDALQGNASVLATLTSDPAAGRRRAYLKGAGQELARVLEEIRRIWARDGEYYAFRFMTAGGAESPFASTNAAFDRLLNHMIEYLEILADVRLGGPIGRTFQGLPQSGDVQSDRSLNSVVDIRNDLRGVENVWYGRFDDRPADMGLRDMVAQLSTEVSQATTDALKKAIEAVEALPEPLQETAQNDPALVEAAFQAVRDLKNRFRLDVAALLETTLTFSGNDGD